MLAVDEGVYTDALQLLNGEVTENISQPWCEYVDSTHLMGALCRKLCPDAKITHGGFMGAGKNQQHAMDQYKSHLVEWSKANPEHSLKFI